jgi:plasmid stabilization system protein ParE
MNFRILPEAAAEITAAAQWYEDRKAGLAENFLTAVADAQEAIKQHPNRYPPPVRVRTKRNVRRFILSEFPYLVVYEGSESEILIVAVPHAQRRPGYWLTRFK